MHIFVKLIEKKPYAKFLFHSVMKFLGMMRHHFNVSKIIFVNDKTNSGLQVNFWKIWLMPFSLIIKKYFKQKLLLCSQLPFKLVKNGYFESTIFGEPYISEHNKFKDVLSHYTLQNKQKCFALLLQKMAFEYLNGICFYLSTLVPRVSNYS